MRQESNNQGSNRSEVIDIIDSINHWWSSVHSPTRYMVYVIGACQFVSLLYSQLYYSLAVIPYFITVKYYEAYRIFTSLFVIEGPFSFILSILMFIICASRVENKDGNGYFVDTLTFLVNLLNTLFYTLIFGIFLHFKPEYGYLFSISGFSDIWGVFLMFEVFSCSDTNVRPEERQYRTAFLILILVFMVLSGVIVPLIVIGLLYLIKPLYTPHKSVIKFFIPYPIFKWLLEQENKMFEEQKALEEWQGQQDRHDRHDRHDRPRVMSIGDITGSDGVYDMRSTQQPMQSSQPAQESRWKGTGRIHINKL